MRREISLLPTSMILSICRMKHLTLRRVFNASFDTPMITYELWKFKWNTLTITSTIMQVSLLHLQYFMSIPHNDVFLCSSFFHFYAKNNHRYLLSWLSFRLSVLYESGPSSSEAYDAQL